MRVEDIASITLAVVLIIGIEVAYFFMIYRFWIINGLIYEEKLKMAFFIVTHILYCNLWINYIACMFTKPGRVEDEYAMRFKLCSETGLILAPPETQPKDMPRWCHRCGRVKPPRAHHCSSCETCVLKMDHHCPWMGSCVGLRNHGHFVRFLVFVTLTCLSTLACHVLWVYDEYVLFGTQDPMVLSADWRLVTSIFTGVLLIGIIFLVGSLAGYHIYNITLNKTTIEAMEEERLRKQLHNLPIRQSYRFPYTLDAWFENIKVTMGRRWYLYPIPWPYDQSSDGYMYAVHPKALHGGQWPIRFKELEDVEEPIDGPLAEASLEYRRKIRRDEEGYTLPRRLFPEFYIRQEAVCSDPHLVSDSDMTIVKRSGTRSLSPKS